MHKRLAWVTHWSPCDLGGRLRQSNFAKPGPSGRISTMALQQHHIRTTPPDLLSPWPAPTDLLLLDAAVRRRWHAVCCGASRPLRWLII